MIRRSCPPFGLLRRGPPGRVDKPNGKSNIIKNRWKSLFSFYFFYTNVDGDPSASSIVRTTPVQCWPFFWRLGGGILYIYPENKIRLCLPVVEYYSMMMKYINKTCHFRWHSLLCELYARLALTHFRPLASFSIGIRRSSSVNSLHINV